MNFIKKVFDKKEDESIHLQFQKFSKGEFRDRALLRAKAQSGGKYTIWTSAEFANGLVRDVAEKARDETVQVKGAVVSTSDLKDKLDFKDIKQFQGVKRYLIDKEMKGQEIINLLNEFPKTFFALSFKASKDDTALKIKPKAPKSGKPGKEKEGGPKADFCTLKTKDTELAKSFIFEKPDFKEAEVNHTFFIEQLEIPEALKSSKDFAKMREGAIRVGKIVRKAKIDGKEKTTEFELRA